MTAKQKAIGRPVERVEDARLLTGRGRYVDDIRFDGMLHAVIVRSSVAHGRLKGVDTSEAKRMPGVHAVFTARDVQEKVGSIPRIPVRLSPLPEMEPFGQGIIASDRVRYVGEPIASITSASITESKSCVPADVPNVVFRPYPVGE